MNRFHFIPVIFLMLIIFACERERNDVSTNDLSNVELSDFIIDNYSDDAWLLYYDEVYNDSSHANYSNVEIDTLEVESVLKIIQTVYNLNCPERDSVFDYYEIHARYCYSFQSLVLEVDTGSPAIQNLSDEIFPTGDDNLDELLELYAFDSVKLFYSYPDFNWLTIFTDHKFNLIPIEKQFKQLPQIMETDFSTLCIGDGNTITLERHTDYAIITFSIGSGDCPAGCIFHKYWEFRVKDGVAEFEKTYGNYF